MSLREALMTNCGAWLGPVELMSWYWMPGYNSFKMETGFLPME